MIGLKNVSVAKTYLANTTKIYGKNLINALKLTAVTEVWPFFLKTISHYPESSFEHKGNALKQLDDHIQMDARMQSCMFVFS